MFDCFKKKAKAPQVKEPERPINTIGPDDNVPIALVVGHNHKSQGATNYLGESEYRFNKRIANKIQQKLLVNGIKTAIIERPTGSYSYQSRKVAEMCKELGVEFSMHMHFNSASSKARGCEVLVAPTSTKLDDNFADYMTDRLNKEYGFRERHEDGIKRVYKGHRGYTMLAAVRDKGIIPVLLEPTFANHRHRESILIFEQEDKYVDLLVDCLYKVARGELPGYGDE